MFEYVFLRNAFFASIIASVICGIIGTIIVEKKLVMMSGGIAHASFGGIGLGYFLGIEPIIGGLFFAIGSAIGIVSIKNKAGTYADSLIAMFWSCGMALGVLFVALTKGYPPDLTSYLFGDILAVTSLDLRFILVLSLFVIFIIFSMFNYWKIYLFDEEFLVIKGINTKWLEYLMYILISVSIIVLVKVVGIVLIIALLTIPPSIAKMFTYNLKNEIILSIVLGIIFSLTGLFLSYYLNIPSGATIILVSSFGYIITFFLKNYKH